MARIRSVKPEFWTHEDVLRCSRDARLLFIGLWNFCDANGVHPAKTLTLRCEVFPGDDDVTITMVERWVVELISAGLMLEFEAAGKKYWYLPGFKTHQIIDKEKPRHPAPSDKDLRQKVVERPTSSGRVSDEYPTTDLVQGLDLVQEQELKGAQAPPSEANDQKNEPGPEPLPEPSPSPEPEPEPEPPKRRERAEDVPVPPELDTAEFRETWTAWIASRRAHRYPMSAAFASDKLKAFVRYGPKATAAAMRESVEQGWQGVFPENYDLMTGARRGKRNEPSRTGPGQRYAGAGVGGDHPGAAACVSGPRSEAGARDPAGSAGRVVNGRWVEAG